MKTLYLLFLCSFSIASAEISPLPRFVSLRSKAVHTHVGPGGDYPLEWRYVRQYLPVEIIAEFDNWRQIRDAEGSTGWVHKSLLSSRRYSLIVQKKRKIYAKPNAQGSVVAIAEPGSIGKLMECHQDWCRVTIKGHKGWIKRRFLWGAYPHEEKFS